MMDWNGLQKNIERGNYKFYKKGCDELCYHLQNLRDIFM